MVFREKWIGKPLTNYKKNEKRVLVIVIISILVVFAGFFFRAK